MFAWRHLQMSPLGAYVRGAGPDRAALPLSLLKSIHRDGYQSFLREWAGLLDKEAPLDAFGRKRMDDLLNAAADFDNTGQYDCTAFVEFVRGYETREPPTGSAVRVMTVHQAKGLGFDAVILPELMGQSVTGGGQPGFIISRHRTDSARWALKMPRRMVAENDPVLAAELKAYDEDECFEELCVRYVAMTRARRGLYMITSYPGPTAKSMDHGALIKTRLAGDMKPASGPVAVLAGEETTCLYERGKRSWYTSKTPAPAAPAPVPRIADDFPGKKSVRMPLRHIEPSEETEHVRKASWLFNPEARDVLSFGSAIHELFQAVEWSDDADVDELVSRWAERSPVSDEVKRDVGRQFADAFPGGEIAQLLRRPEEDTELWRERHFEMVMDDRLIAGAFDRVTIRRDSYGKPVSAVIVDYKSDRIAGDSELEKAVKTHRPQLTLYRRALAAMLGMSESKVAAKLAFTRPGKVVDVQ
jgi:ATP-dependent helicase/nuclease subunit A